LEGNKDYKLALTLLNFQDGIKGPIWHNFSNNFMSHLCQTRYKKMASPREPLKLALTEVLL